MLKRLSTLIISLTTLVLLLSSTSMAAVSTSASSASISSGDGLKVSPVRTDVTIEPGHSQIVKLFIQNITKGTATFQVIVNNFTANGESGVPALYLKGNDNESIIHGLKQFIAPISDVTLKANQEKAVNVVITIPKNNAGGGYYGAVRFAPASVTSKNSVSLSASVASLILVTVPGPALRQQLNLSSFVVSQNNQVGSLFFSNKNIKVIAKFDNTGNVQVEPFGKIIVKNSSGKTLLTKSINNAVPPGNVLPDSIRAFKLTLNNLSSFGKYSVSGNFGYGTNGQLLSATTTFYVIAPWIIILVVAIIVIIILVIIFMPKLFRAWYKRSISKQKN